MKLDASVSASSGASNVADFNFGAFNLTGGGGSSGGGPTNVSKWIPIAVIGGVVLLGLVAVLVLFRK
jgi:hypothetical protein